MLALGTYKGAMCESSLSLLPTYEISILKIPNWCLSWFLLHRYPIDSSLTPPYWVRLSGADFFINYAMRYVRLLYGL